MTNAVLLTLPNKNNEVQVQCGNMKSFVPISDISISTNKKLLLISLLNLFLHQQSLKIFLLKLMLLVKQLMKQFLL